MARTSISSKINMHVLFSFRFEIIKQEKNTIEFNIWKLEVLSCIVTLQSKHKKATVIKHAIASTGKISATYILFL